MSPSGIKGSIRVVIITGANNGIGFHMTRSLLGYQYRVAAFDLSGENLSKLKDAFPDQLLFYLCDVTKPHEISEAVQDVVQRWGQIDILVNNACLCIFSPFEEKSLELARQELEVNYFGYLHMINAVLPYMKVQGKGIIHNVSSGVGITGFHGISGYASAKGAIEALTRTLSLELAPYGISVNLMHPPLTNTQSAAPLGIPSQAMADPASVGQKLAKKIESIKPVITPDWQTALYLHVARRYPIQVGRLFSKLALNAKKKHPITGA